MRRSKIALCHTCLVQYPASSEELFLERWTNDITPLGNAPVTLCLHANARSHGAAKCRPDYDSTGLYLVMKYGEPSLV
ncbi:hypothetical protein BU24DRAFT_287841 [Aaosphaeria arxii CBS 175.79]|uniref:Uncharacterized protein n=1 Tax=Aaosphaeria arxii CBS 175.79 TaxID=1450172 RepID=A0A6A5XHB5_9PLEO|nr:uncharacterized protein BU24DRAFT_287841 [Aaosphaeria arxii CBS 175.79]KAF2011724.1 hypothetical protein BU24DRAFT_287841 [Aaosphaeria arxii CBS 175.79]